MESLFIYVMSFLIPVSSIYDVYVTLKLSGDVQFGPKKAIFAPSRTHLGEPECIEIWIYKVSECPIKVMWAEITPQRNSVVD